ncbi:HWE histidine kinase domain-containing protein [uncultured Sphingomonas sp.]|uniref:sensor histidine kinase n=1 Tax=uncultured Sphingomonas sp. TaxID=158754 RepID=UPI0025FBBA52|nr:HWE histidine kinase domain-containing protein [uncultured Sphingomonas sp.]
MTDAGKVMDDKRELDRLLDEVEQLRTALEASADEVDRLVDERDRLLRRVTGQARELQAANTAYSKASAVHELNTQAGLVAQLQSDQDQEELRVAFEEMQVLTEELETANNSLLETNKTLDRRVEERTRELEGKNRELGESEVRFRTLVEGIPQLVWRAGEGGNWTWASPQWVAYTGLNVEDSAGAGWLRALHPDDREAARSAWSRANAAEAMTMEGRIFHQAEQRYRHFRTRAMAALGPDGEVIEWLGTSTDVDDLLALQERQQVLVAELQHRTRNLLGVVRSVAERTGEASGDYADFRTRFRDRLEALARVQGLLSRLGESDRVAFDELLGTELAAMDGAADRVALDGPPGIRLRSSMVQTLAMALHELATNAMKYGALAQPQGHLAIRWQLGAPDTSGRPRLEIDWRESGVRMPAAALAPQGSGQGRELIERALPYQLGADTHFELGPDGVHCTIAISVSDSNLVGGRRP